MKRLSRWRTIFPLVAILAIPVSFAHDDALFYATNADAHTSILVGAHAKDRRISGTPTEKPGTVSDFFYTAHGNFFSDPTGADAAVVVWALPSPVSCDRAHFHINKGARSKVYITVNNVNTTSNTIDFSVNGDVSNVTFKHFSSVSSCAAAFHGGVN